MPWADDDNPAAIPSGAEPTTGHWADEPTQPKGIGPMPGILTALTQGIGSAREDVGESLQTVEGQRPQAPKPETSPAAQPLEWSDVLHPSQLLPKVAYEVGKGSPTIGGGIAGGLLGTGVAGPAGGLAGGALGAAAGNIVSQIGPEFQRQLQRFPGDEEAAWSHTVAQSAIGGGAAGLGWLLFGANPFTGVIKNMVFQAAGVQPAVSVAEQAMRNVANDRPATEGLQSAYTQGALGTAVPMAGHAALNLMRPAPQANLPGPPKEAPLPTGQLRDIDFATPVPGERQGPPTTLGGKASDWFKRTFTPETYSPVARRAYDNFRQMVSGIAQFKDSTIADMDQAHRDFEAYSAQDPVGAINFMKWAAKEPVGNYQPPPNLQQHQTYFAKLMGMINDADNEAGNYHGYIMDYFPRLYNDPVGVKRWLDSRPGMGGADTGYRKGRTFDTLQDALDAGFTLKTTNAADLVTHRLISSAETNERLNLLTRLNDARLAGKIFTDEQRRNAVGAGWELIKDPVGGEWALHPDLMPTWNNVLATKGLWADQGALGTAFRGWMGVKNSYVPLKLSLSGFHPLHVAHINTVEGLTRGWQQLTEGNIPGAVGAVIKGLSSVFTNATPYLQTRGKFAREAWLTPEWKQTPEQNQVVQWMKEAGFSPQLDEQMRTASTRAFSDAMANSNWGKAAWAGARNTLHVGSLQKAIFENWIPSLKTSAFLDRVQDLSRRRPDIMNDDYQRKVALGTIAKSIDNRYGEMFYKNLPWNKMVKDAGIGSFLSLGWNLGFVREFVGGFGGDRLLDRALGNVVDNPTREAIDAVKNKTSFAMTYMGMAAMLNGILSYSQTGQFPEGMDYFLPRLSGTNPDGSPRRISNMFYTREVPMLQKHIEEQQSVLGGIKSMLWNKMMFEPFVEFANNRDYYGYNIMDENSPWYQQAAQAAKYVLSDQLNPITFTGAKRALQAVGKWDNSGTPAAVWNNIGNVMSSTEGRLAMAGMGPAPTYASKSETLNRLNFLYNKYVAPQERPQLDRQIMEDRRNAQMALTAAKASGDPEAIARAQAQVYSFYGKRYNKSLGSDVYQFQHLPASIQKQFLQNIPPDDFKKYYLHSNKRIRSDQDLLKLQREYQGQ